MQFTVFWMLTAFLLALPTSVRSPADKGQWSLVWSDEFNGRNTTIDATKWVIETGGGGFGNDELEYYTARPQNVQVRHGHLIIEAFQEKYTGPDGVTRDYTSARLKTQTKFSQAYGRFEARIKIPRGQGLWPAFWLLGVDIDRIGWPDDGEIDIMENVGKEPSAVHGTIHGPGYSGAGGISASYSLPHGLRFADHFHVFAVEWEPEVIRFYTDGQRYATRTPKDLPGGKKWVFDHPFFIILNVAVGGNWPGNPDSSTVFPQTMLVDYVRVYRRANR